MEQLIPTAVFFPGLDLSEMILSKKGCDMLQMCSFLSGRFHP